jgi:hypothetical protein
MVSAKCAASGPDIGALGMAKLTGSGPFGTMGVGLPFGIGAKIAKPDKRVIVVHGDGRAGLKNLHRRIGGVSA